MNFSNRKIRQLNMLITVLLLTSLFLTGCQRENQTNSAENGKIRIVATTTMLADMAENIGGKHVIVNSLMGPGIDPHLYQASAGDVTKMQNADVILYNGLHLEGKMGDIFASLSSLEKYVISIEDGLDKENLLASLDNKDLFDPHIWFDVSLWKSASEYFTSQLCEADTANAEYYRENLKAYLSELDELDQYIKDKSGELKEEQKILITAHDAFRYFGNKYGFEVKGLQGISTDSEAGTADMMNLAQFIADNKIKAVFVESSVPPKTIEALQAAVKSRGFNTNIGGELYSDSLGDANSGADTYVLTFKANIDTIVNSLK